MIKVVNKTGNFTTTLKTCLQNFIVDSFKFVMAVSGKFRSDRKP